MSGCSKLARIEEDIVTAFTEVGGDDNTRLTVTLNRAYWVCPAPSFPRAGPDHRPQSARQGRYEQAIASLLEPDVWRGLTVPDYNLWAAEIWRILALRACRRSASPLFPALLPVVLTYECTGGSSAS